MKIYDTHGLMVRELAIGIPTSRTISKPEIVRRIGMAATSRRSVWRVASIFAR